MTQIDNVPNAHKKWSKHMRSLVGGDCKVTAYLDEAEQNKTHIFTSSSSMGIVAATIGLMEFNQSQNPEIAIYTEIVMDRRGHDLRIANILSTIAFYVMKNSWKISPGVIFESMVAMYIPDTTLPHVMFTAPFQWDNMYEVVLGEKTIYPLIAIPISEAERKVAATNAGCDLESLWVDRSVDVLDWSRPSVVR